jgi:hypothetical protein
MHARLFYARTGPILAGICGNGGVVQFDGKSPLDVGNRKLRALKELIADWSHALALVIVPGALVGALLK